MKAKKFVGPSEKMKKALEDEGLHVEWPTEICDDGENLAIEGTFCTGQGWEKLVLIDLRNRVGLESKSGVDNAISYELDAASSNYDIDEEMGLSLGQDGAPSAAELLEDLKETESKLHRFSIVADAMSGGRPVPPEDDEEVVEIPRSTVENIVSLLEYARNHAENISVEHCSAVIDELTKKLEA